VSVFVLMVVIPIDKANKPHATTVMGGRFVERGWIPPPAGKPPVSSDAFIP